MSNTEQRAFTPGPWFIEGADLDPQRPWIAAPHQEDGGDIVCDAPDDDCEASLRRWPANARLIAAAPTMAAYIGRRANEGDADAVEILKAAYGR